MTTVQDVLRFLEDSRVFSVATVDGNKPSVRPFSGIHEFEGKLYMPTSNRKKVFAQMMANPNVEISGMAHGKWIRIEAKIVCDKRMEARKSMLDHYGAALTGMYSLDDGKFEVVYLNHAKATIYSFTEAPVVIEF